MKVNIGRQWELYKLYKSRVDLDTRIASVLTDTKAPNTFIRMSFKLPSQSVPLVHCEDHVLPSQLAATSFRRHTSRPGTSASRS